jgi:hypothetical protein
VAQPKLCGQPDDIDRGGALGPGLLAAPRAGQGGRPRAGIQGEPGARPYQLGYFDQPHLARSLTRYIGRTATQLRAEDPPEPLSLLYKT